MSNATETMLRGFIGENFMFGGDAASLDARASLIDEGLIDSTGVLELVSFLEERFGLQIADEDIVPENMGSIEAIVAFVTRKTASALQAA